MRYMYGGSLSSLSLVSSHPGDFPIQSSTCMAGGGQAACPNILVYGACAVYQCVLVRIMVAYSSAV